MQCSTSDSERLASLDLSERRKGYNNYVAVGEIPAWDQYLKRNLLEQAQVVPSEKLTEDCWPSQPGLAGKVCLWRGDITKLEVSGLLILLLILALL